MNRFVALFVSGAIEYQPSHWHNGKPNPTASFDKQKPAKIDSTAMADSAHRLTIQGAEHYKLQQWQAAKPYFQQAEKIYRQLGAANTGSPFMSNLANTLMNHGILCDILQNSNTAKNCYQKAEQFYQQLGAANVGSLFMSELANTLTNRGLLHNNLQEWQPAKDCYQQAEQFYRQLGAANADSAFMSNLAKTLMNRSLLHNRLQEWQLAKDYCQQAEQFYQQLGAANADSEFMSDLAKTLMNRGLLHDSLQEWQPAKDCYQQAEQFYRQLDAANAGSPFMSDLANTLMNRGNLHKDLQEWQPAKACYQEAEQFYRQLGATNADSPFINNLACTLMNRGLLHNNLQEWQPAKDCYQQAEQFYRQLGATNAGSLFMNNLACTLMNRGNLDKDLQEWQPAKACYQEAEQFYRQLGATNVGSLFMRNLALTLMGCGVLHCRLQESDTAKTYSLETFSLYEKLQTYEGRFLDDLLFFSRQLLIPLFNDTSLATFQRLANLVFRYQEQLHQAQISFECRQDKLMDLWEVWLLHALDKQDTALLFAVVSASYARRLSLLTRLHAEHSTPFLALTNTLEQLSVQLEVLDNQLSQSLEPDEAAKLQHEQLSSQYNTLYQQRGQLTQADSFDALHTVFNDAELQQTLAADSAILFSISFADYKLEQVDDTEQPVEADRPPLLLLLRKHEILKVDAPKLNTAAHALQALYRLQTQNPVVLLRHAECRKPNFDFIAPDSLAINQAMNEIEQSMSEVWQTLDERYLHGINHLTIIGHGKLNGLPWQGFQPPDSGISVRQYTGLYALPARKNSRYRRLPYPSATTPLALLACTADYEPHLHLYYVEAEVLMIQRVWGEAAVKRIRELKHAPENSLLLLIGHGNQQQGRGVFVLGQDKVLEQHDILAHQAQIHALGASACLLARSEDINAEPLGVLSLATCRQDVQFSYGALTPIDDFLTTCLSLLFHVAWRESQNPNTAMRTALTQLETGVWSDDAQLIFKEVFTDYLPVMFAKMETDKKTYDDVVRQRIANCRQDWQDSAASKEAYNKWVRNQQTELTHNLVSCVLNDLMQITPHFQSKLARFLPFWLWG